MYRSSRMNPSWKSARHGRALTWLLCVAALLIAGTPAASAQKGPGEPLLSYLRKGGFVLFIRHLNTYPDQADTDPLHLENVAAQRLLTEEGKARASSLGAALRTLGIPVERVVSSKFKRAQDSAQHLAVAQVETSLDVTEGGLVASPRENLRRANALKALLTRTPAAGKNLVIVSHRPNLLDALGKDYFDFGEGEVAVFRPSKAGQPKLIQRVPLDAWVKWAAKAPVVKGAAAAPVVPAAAVAPAAAPVAAFNYVQPAAPAPSAPAAQPPAAQAPAAPAVLPTGRAPVGQVPAQAPVQQAPVQQAVPAAAAPAANAAPVTAAPTAAPAAAASAAPVPAQPVPAANTATPRPAAP